MRTKNKTENHTVNKKQNAEKNAVARNNVQKTEKKEAQTSEKENFECCTRNITAGTGKRGADSGGIGTENFRN